MSTERDDRVEDPESELYEDVPPRSIFAATWFRVVLVVIVLGVVGAVAVPYILDLMNPPLAPRTAATVESLPGSVPTDAAAADRPASEGAGSLDGHPATRAVESSREARRTEGRSSTATPYPAGVSSGEGGGATSE